MRAIVTVQNTVATGSPAHGPRPVFPDQQPLTRPPFSVPGCYELCLVYEVPTDGRRWLLVHVNYHVPCQPGPQTACLSCTAGKRRILYTYVFRTCTRTMYYAVQADCCLVRHGTWYERTTTCTPPAMEPHCLGSGSMPGMSIALREACACSAPYDTCNVPFTVLHILGVSFVQLAVPLSLQSHAASPDGVFATTPQHKATRSSRTRTVTRLSVRAS